MSSVQVNRGFRISSTKIYFRFQCSEASFRPRKRRVVTVQTSILQLWLAPVPSLRWLPKSRLDWWLESDLFSKSRTLWHVPVCNPQRHCSRAGCKSQGNITATNRYSLSTICLLFLNNYPGTLKNLTDLKTRSSAARFLEEEVRLVFEYVGKLEPVFKGMVGKLATIHEVYRMVRVDFFTSF